jgi:hypothetical protein
MAANVAAVSLSSPGGIDEAFESRGGWAGKGENSFPSILSDMAALGKGFLLAMPHWSTDLPVC